MLELPGGRCRRASALCGMRSADGPALGANLRYWTYTCHQIKAHCDAGRLPLAQAHAVMNDAKSRLAALRNHLRKTAWARRWSRPRRFPKMWHSRPRLRLNSLNGRHSRGRLCHKFAQNGARRAVRCGKSFSIPRTIQWLAGPRRRTVRARPGDLAGDFGDIRPPWKVAVALGIGNAVVLGGGWAIIRFSRYQTAGRAITLWPVW